MAVAEVKPALRRFLHTFVVFRAHSKVVVKHQHAIWPAAGALIA